MQCQSPQLYLSFPPWGLCSLVWSEGRGFLHPGKSEEQREEGCKIRGCIPRSSFRQAPTSQTECACAAAAAVGRCRCRHRPKLQGCKSPFSSSPPLSPLPPLRSRWRQRRRQWPRCFYQNTEEWWLPNCKLSLLWPQKQSSQERWNDPSKKRKVETFGEKYTQMNLLFEKRSGPSRMFWTSSLFVCNFTQSKAVLSGIDSFARNKPYRQTFQQKYQKPITVITRVRTSKYPIKPAVKTIDWSNNVIGHDSAEEDGEAVVPRGGGG